MRKDTHKPTTGDYFRDASPGTIIAFKAEQNGAACTLSGKIIDEACDCEGCRRVETKNGTIFNVSLSDAVWVKTGNRWPSWVFEQFKEKSK